MRKPLPIYSVRRAKKNLLDAIRQEIASTVAPWRNGVNLTTAIARRECAVRDLVAAVRAEKVRP